MKSNSLTQLEVLLAKALRSMTIGNGKSEQIGLAQYRALLQRGRSIYSLDERFTIASYRPEVTNNEIKRKILEIVGRELADHIQDGKILSASIVFAGAWSALGSPVEELMRNLLKRAIVDSPAKAVQEFAKCKENSSCTLHRFFLLTGVTVPESVELLDGISLIPLAKAVPQLPHYLPPIFSRPNPIHSYDHIDLLGKMLVQVEYNVSPIFLRPAYDYSPKSGPLGHFVVKPKCQESTNFDIDQLCWALSLAARCCVEATMDWYTLLDYEIYDLTSGLGIGGARTSTYISPRIRDDAVTLTPQQLDTIKNYYHKLTDLPAGQREKLHIPIKRWMKSMAEDEPINQIIDLGIALEALYVPDTSSEIRYRLSNHAAWHLGNGKNHRQELYKEFQQIYDARSDAVHTGKLRGKRAKPSFDVQKFTTRAQDLCWQGIDKVIDAGEIPDWQNLVMGEERCQPT